MTEENYRKAVVTILLAFLRMAMILASAWEARTRHDMIRDHRDKATNLYFETQYKIEELS